MDIGTFKASVDHTVAFWPVLISKAYGKHGLRDAGPHQAAGLFLVREPSGHPGFGTEHGLASCKPLMVSSS